MKSSSGKIILQLPVGFAVKPNVYREQESGEWTSYKRF